MSGSDDPSFEEWFAFLMEDARADEDMGDLDTEEEWRMSFMPSALQVEYSTKVLRESGAILAAEGPEVTERFFRSLDGLYCDLSHAIFDEEVAVSLRAEGFRAMEILYRDAFAKGGMDELCYMWWDHMRYFGDATPAMELRDVIQETLERILFMPTDGLECAWAALHGLGHFEHPKRGEVIDRWCASRADLDDDTLGFAQAARKGEVL